MKNLRATLVLLALTLAICGVGYPLALWAFARCLFPQTASGSLVTAKGPDGIERVVGSARIAQSFDGDEYFRPRPSAASYNGAAAGGSNWGASNPKLRDRVARQLGPIIQYKKGSPSAGAGPAPRTPQQDIEAWFAVNPDPAVENHTAAACFDMWLQDPANRAKVMDLEPVPADQATASGSGLDPHITVRNALSVLQLDRVAAKRTVAGGDRETTKQGIAELVRTRSFSPLFGLVGEPLVNVLELNIELDERFPFSLTPDNRHDR
jgi:K+-transporting ATPase c subunit